MKSFSRIFLFIVIILISAWYIKLSLLPNPVVSLRKFPFPYQAALAICSDIDETKSVEKFIEIQRFLNTDQQTEYGGGLGLEIGNSFLFYNEYFHHLNKPGADTASIDAMFSGLRDVGISLFTGISDTLAEGSHVIIDLIRAGYVDVLHSYGTFSQNGFDREMAISAIEFLKAESPLVDVFVNHGGPENRSNIGDAPWQEGDNSESPAYHTDVTIHAGFKFLWRGHLTHCIGQDGSFSFLNSAKLYYESFQDWKYEPQEFHNDNELVHLFELDDGRKMFDFVRFINPWGKYSIPQEEFITHQLSLNVVDQLITNKGYMVFYTHFGTTQTKPYLHDGTIEVLRYIKDKASEDSLFVTTTSKLLNYYIHHKYLFWHFVESPGQLDIVIDSIANEVEGMFVPKIGELEGITFYVPDSLEIVLKIGQQPIEFVTNPEDESGNISISISWKRLVWPTSLQLQKDELR